MKLLCGGGRARGLRQTSHSAMDRGFLPPPFFFCGCWCNFFSLPPCRMLQRWASRSALDKHSLKEGTLSVFEIKRNCWSPKLKAGVLPQKKIKFKVAEPLKFNSESLSYSTENCGRLLPDIYFSHDSEGEKQVSESSEKQDLDFQSPGSHAGWDWD